MNVSWVAASTRIQGLARARAGVGACRAAASADGLTAAAVVFADSAYGPRLSGIRELGAAQRAVAETVVWQLRVLSGWLPPGATRIAAAVAAVFERSDLIARYRTLSEGTPPRAPFQLGSLATAWPAAGTATTLEEFRAALRRSAWGDTRDDGSAGDLADALTASLLHRLSLAAPVSRGWCESACALLAARLTLIDGAAPRPALTRACAPLIGERWSRARTVDDLRALLPRSARVALAALDEPEELWRSEVALAQIIDENAVTLLRRHLPGPEVVAGGLAVLLVDAWRAQAALAAAEATRPEVFDVVA